MQAELDSAAFAELMVFCQRLEPFGQPWRQAAEIAAAAVSPWAKGASWRDFMPAEWQAANAPPGQSEEEQTAMVQFLGARLAGQAQREEK